jgi:opacity protein-like surface antigen
VRAAHRLLLALAVPISGGALAAQGYRLRVDTRLQAVGYRGVQLDSIPASDTVTGPGGGPATSDGFAVHCSSAASYCTYFRPGPVRHGGPLVTSADLTLWGFGARGLSAHATARAGVDLGGADAWPGTDPAVQLLSGYVEYAVERVTARAGRQVAISRLGTTGFDGAAVTLRDGRRGLEASAYAGWGLARGVALPVTSPALNPLDDFQPQRRQLVAGIGVGWSAPRADLRLDYQREVDPRSDYFVSERVGLSGAVRPAARWSVVGGADYDLAAGWWGSAEAALGYATRTVSASVGARRYRPHFDLWTIWGAFSPVPYRAVEGRLALRALPQVQLRARGERYRFDAAEAATPLVEAERSGWRGELGVTATPAPGWTVDAGYRGEFGPGAASLGASGSITYAPSGPYSVTVHGAALDRPLEFRYNESALHLYGFEADAGPGPRLRLSLGASRYVEDRHRPDAAAFDWGQWRVTVGAVVLFGRGDDLGVLPPAVRRMPGGRAAR